MNLGRLSTARLRLACLSMACDGLERMPGDASVSSTEPAAEVREPLNLVSR